MACSDHVHSVPLMISHPNSIFRGRNTWFLFYCKEHDDYMDMDSNTQFAIMGIMDLLLVIVIVHNVQMQNDFYWFWFAKRVLKSMLKIGPAYKI